MRVATRLALGFAIQILLLGGLLAYHVKTIRDSASIAHDLTAISSRVYRTASEQVGRVAQLEENSAKYLVTRDPGYLAKFNELAGEFSEDLAALQLHVLTPAEQTELRNLRSQWAELSASLPGHEAPPTPNDAALLPEAGLDSLRVRSIRLSFASYEAMLAQLQRSDEAAHRAERLSWIAALLVLFLTIVVAATVVRSIGTGLRRLTAGTKEVAKGRFGYRLATDGSDEFAQVARDFNTMTARLDELDRMKRDFASKVSHDLKTPLASMQETIRALLDGLPGALNARQRRLLELNQQSGERLYGMLVKLLELSRLEAGGVEPEFGDVDVAATVRQVATAHDVETDIPSDNGGLVVRGDNDRILQLLQNLVENATKFSPEGGVVLAVEPLVDGEDARWLRIAVADRGPGVREGDRRRIFERFYQGEAGRAVQSRGVGLGLTICHEIVAMHNGTIRVMDRPGGGSMFEVMLPVGDIAQVNGGSTDAGATPGRMAAAGASPTAATPSAGIEWTHS